MATLWKFYIYDISTNTIVWSTCRIEQALSLSLSLIPAAFMPKLLHNGALPLRALTMRIVVQIHRKHSQHRIDRSYAGCATFPL